MSKALESNSSGDWTCNTINLVSFLTVEFYFVPIIYYNIMRVKLVLEENFSEIRILVFESSSLIFKLSEDCATVFKIIRQKHSAIFESKEEFVR